MFVWYISLCKWMHTYVCVLADDRDQCQPACFAQCLSIVETGFIPEPEFIIWLGWLYLKLCISICVFASAAGVLNLSYHTWLSHGYRVISTLLPESFSQLLKNFCPHNDHRNIMKYSIKYIPVYDRLILFYKYFSCSTFLQLWVDVKIPFIEYNFQLLTSTVFKMDYAIFNSCSRLYNCN